MFYSLHYRTKKYDCVFPFTQQHNRVPKMEKFVQLFFNAFSSIGAFPYTTFLPTDSKNYELVLSKGIKYYIWCATAFLLFFHWFLTSFYLIHSSKYYLEHDQLIKLIFHIFWAIAYVVMALDHVVFSFHQNEVIQLVNGTIQLGKHLQRSKKF